MEPTSLYPRPTPEDGCKVQRPKRSDIFSHQDEDKSPNKTFHNIIPSSKYGCKVQRPKRSDIFLHQDEDKSPNKTFHSSIPSSKNLKQK